MASDERRYVMIAPNGKVIRGTGDTIPAVANVSHWTKGDDGEPVPEWTGDTDVGWDGQATEQHCGSSVVVDVNGNEWLERECVLRLDDDDGLPLEEPEDEGQCPMCDNTGVGPDGVAPCSHCGKGEDDGQEYIVEPGMVDAGEYTFAVCDLDGHIVAAARTDAEARLVADALTERRAQAGR